MVHTCGICTHGPLEIAEEFYTYVNITSDCRPWPAGRSLSLCPSCGVMRRVLLSAAEPVFATVYENYEMYGHASGATDQLNFSRAGIPMGRTQKILQFIEDKLKHSPSSVLDIGSGSGAGLLALAGQYPAASIYGFEPNDHPAERQKFLPDNVKTIFNVRPSGQRYDMVSLFHVLEHIDDADEVLAYVRSVLSPEGHVLIQVPYPAHGPFDLVVADHIWHFSKSALATLLHKAGFTPVYIGNDLIDKELTVLAMPGQANAVHHPDESEVAQARQAIQWLGRYKLFLDDIKSHHAKLAIYGTGPSGAWVGHMLGDQVECYLDDDPARSGSSFNGVPVITPQNMADPLPVIAPFPEYQAKWIAERNKGLNILFFSGDTQQVKKRA